MTSHDEELLAEILLQWEELYERGQDSSPQELCRDCPHLSGELAKRIAAMKATDWLNNPDCPAEDSTAAASRRSQGKVLGSRYRLDDLIATGGFAEVWRAFDTELQRVVAIKLPKPSRLASATNFITEARRVARLKHPYIVPVHDVGTEGSSCFIVSEYIEGGSLGDRLTKSPPPRQETIRWLSEIAGALEYAHLHGVIHRDIKPANILIDHHGRALLADFGIAQSAQKTGAFAPSLGTLRYMSPEQLEGKPATPQSDVYSLGVVLYESLTGRLPYRSENPNDLRREIARDPRVLDQSLPRSLLSVCQKAMQLRPERRHVSAAHFSAELQRKEHPFPKHSAWWQPTLAIFALAAMALLAATLGLRRPVAERATPSSVVPNRLEDPTAKEALASGEAIRLPHVKNSIGMTLIQIPPGEFQMGSSTGFSNEAPVHRVTITKSFFIGQTEVTNRDWKRVMGSVQAAWGSPDRPARWVSWEQANDFCQKLSSLPDERTAGHHYRLPTEAEWEYACRAGSDSAYTFGDRTEDHAQYAWFVNNSGMELLDGDALPPGKPYLNAVDENRCSTQSVGRLKANAWGLFDMHGNVGEWCSDWYGDYPNVATTDPLGPADGPRRIFRGGAWRAPSNYCRSSCRCSNDPTYQLDDLGFRVVMELLHPSTDHQTHE